MPNKRLWLLNKRQEKGLSQEQVAEQANIKRAYYTMIENGTRDPSVDVAKKVAQALGFCWVIFFENESNEKNHIKATV